MSSEDSLRLATRERNSAKLQRPVCPTGWAADVGVVAFRATDRNNYYATPNKLFDYLVSGVSVVASDFPEMRRLTSPRCAGSWLRSTAG